MLSIERFLDDIRRERGGRFTSDNVIACHRLAAHERHELAVLERLEVSRKRMSSLGIPWPSTVWIRY